MAINFTSLLHLVINGLYPRLSPINRMVNIYIYIIYYMFLVYGICFFNGKRNE